MPFLWPCPNSMPQLLYAEGPPRESTLRMSLRVGLMGAYSSVLRRFMRTASVSRRDCTKRPASIYPHREIQAWKRCARSVSIWWWRVATFCSVMILNAVSMVVTEYCRRRAEFSIENLTPLKAYPEQKDDGTWHLRC